MITLDFIPDQQVIREAHEDNPLQSSSELAITWFLMPFHFTVNDIEFSRYPNGNYAAPALLDVAIAGLAAVRDLEKQDKVVYEALEDGGTYTFQRKGDMVSVSSDIVPGKSASISYIELLSGFESFAKKVHSFLFKEFPELIHHPIYGDWFNERDNYDKS